LHAHEVEAAEIQIEDDQSLISFYYEDEDGNVQKKMVRKEDLNKSDSDMDENQPILV
jgi:hypothetical protein